jgi:hypothetical protein
MSGAPSRTAPLSVMGAILVVSAVLRIVLVLNGGQYFWMDEVFRLHPCLVIVDALRYPQHTWSEVADTIAGQHLHTGFLLIGTPLAALGMWLVEVVSFPSIQTAVALLLSFASVATIGLVYLLARRVGASRWESVLAAFLMAATNCMFFYARHVLPYDSSLAFVLLAAWWAFSPRRSAWRSFVFGLLGSMAYLIYFGYLTSVLAVAAAQVLRDTRPRAVLTHASAVVAGFVVLPLAMHVFTLVHSGGAMPFLDDVLGLMQRADQGGYEEGWTVVWTYLWFTEHGLLLVWLAGIAGVLAFWNRGAEASGGRGVLWLAIAAAIYAQLALTSSVLHRAVVLGRFARQLAPFLCLATAAAARDLADRHQVPRAAWAAAATAVVVQAAFNFSVPLRQWFPSQVESEVTASFDQSSLTHDVSVVGPDWGAPVDRSARYVLMNTVVFLYPATAAAPPPHGRTVLRHDHPLQFLPCQYEVYDAAGREVLQTADISMRLIDTAHAGHDLP